MTHQVLLFAPKDDPIGRIDVPPEIADVIHARCAGFFAEAQRDYLSVDRAIVQAIRSAYLQGFADGSRAPRAVATDPDITKEP